MNGIEYPEGVVGLIAVDFDGTCVEHDFPAVGNDMPGAVDTMKCLYKHGWRFVLNTVRENGSHFPSIRQKMRHVVDAAGFEVLYPSGTEHRFLDDAVLWFERHCIPLEAVNSTPSWHETRKLYGGRKVLADVYIDDKNLLGFGGWKMVRAILIEGKKPRIFMEEKE